MGRELSRLYLANLFDLSGNVAVVTGGNGGIGCSIALGLAQAELPSQFWRATRKRTKSVLGELKALGGRGWALRVDVTVRGNCSKP